jgi:cytochrome c-type biogenesis protein CcmH
MLWVLFALITGLVLAAILRPLLRSAADSPGPTEASAVIVCRDQLAELDSDAARGLIPAREADAARNEISRRLIAATRSMEAMPASLTAWSRAVAVVCAIAIPALSLAVYLVQGRPDLPGVPYAQRIAGALANNDIAALIVRVEDHLAERPGDLEGWKAVAPAYRSLGRHDDAAKAYSRILSLSGPSASLHADLGEALTLAAQGLVTKAAVASFEASLKLDPGNVKARFYRALAHQQDGAGDVAVSQWRSLLADAPPDAPWRTAVEAEIARASAVAPELSEEQLRASQSLAPKDRDALIRSMVDGLTRRLAQDGNDLDGWLRLAKARLVLGQSEQAGQALDRAQNEFRDDAAALARIEEMRKTLTAGSD